MNNKIETITKYNTMEGIKKSTTSIQSKRVQCHAMQHRVKWCMFGLLDHTLNNVRENLDTCFPYPLYFIAMSKRASTLAFNINLPHSNVLESLDSCFPYPLYLIEMPEKVSTLAFHIIIIYFTFLFPFHFYHLFQKPHFHITVLWQRK